MNGPRLSELEPVTAQSERPHQCLEQRQSRESPSRSGSRSVVVALRKYDERECRGARLRGHLFLEKTDHQVKTLDDYAEAVLRAHAPVLYFELAPFLITRVGRDPHALLDGLQPLGYLHFLALSQAGDSLMLTEDATKIVDLAHEKKYIDVLTVAPRARLPCFRRSLRQRRVLGGAPTVRRVRSDRRPRPTRAGRIAKGGCDTLIV